MRVPRFPPSLAAAVAAAVIAAAAVIGCVIASAAAIASTAVPAGGRRAAWCAFRVDASLLCRWQGSAPISAAAVPARAFSAANR